jgi:hypothetical protein
MGDLQLPLIEWILKTLIGKVESQCNRLRNSRRWRRRSIFAVRLLDLRSHFLESFTLIHHFHHVPRDADTDVSSEAHAIKY